MEEPLVAELERAEAARAEAESAHEARQSLRNDAADAVSRWTARVEALQMALDAARARAGAERLSGVDGVLGTLLDLIEIDEGWAPAVEAALGEALTAVVVDDPAAGRRALTALRSSDTSGAVLALGARPASPAAPRIGDAVRPHARSGRPGVSTLLDALLGGAVRVDDVGDAVDAALAHPEAVIVTGGGDRFGLSGWRVGAAGSGATAAALDDAVEHATAARGRTGAGGRGARCRRAGAAVGSGGRGRADRRLDANDAAFHRRVGGPVAERRASIVKCSPSWRTSSVRSSTSPRTSNASEQRIAELEALLPALEADEQAEADAARARGETAGASSSRARPLLASRRKDLEVRNAGLHERQQLLERRLDETERRLAADADARVAAEGQRVTIERDIAAIDRLVDLVTGHRHVVEVLHTDLVEQRRRQSDEVRGLTHRPRSAPQGARREGAAARRVARAGAAGRDSSEAEAKLRLETAVETLRRDLDIEPAVAEAAAAAGAPRRCDAGRPCARPRT